MDPEIVNQLKSLAAKLDSLSPNERAEISYEALSGSLVWSDEIPDYQDVLPGALQGLRPVLRYRTSVIRGEPDVECQHYWEEAQRLFPSWPGFLLTRQSAEFRSLYERLHSEAMAAFDELFDDQEKG